MYILVLSDGETYTTLSGCAILHVVPSNDLPDLDALVKEAYKNGTAYEPNQLYSIHLVTRFH